MLQAQARSQNGSITAIFPLGVIAPANALPGTVSGDGKLAFNTATDAAGNPSLIVTNLTAPRAGVRPLFPADTICLIAERAAQ